MKKINDYYYAIGAIILLIIGWAGLLLSGSKPTLFNIIATIFVLFFVTLGIINKLINSGKFDKD
jgi:hypothetical protein